jgi:hypothetical protein
MKSVGGHLVYRSEGSQRSKIGSLFSEVHMIKQMTVTHGHDVKAVVATVSTLAWDHHSQRRRCGDLVERRRGPV